MTWLFVPGTSSACAPVSQASISEFVSPSPERWASVTWRGKHRLPRLWSRAWRTGAFIQRLSGLTLPPSMLDHGVAQFIASLQETRASPIASPENNSARTMTDGSSITSSGSSMKAGLIVSSVRTCRGTRADNSPISSQHWKDWVAALRREYSARPRSEPATGGNDCSSWPTARANDAEKRGNIDGTDPRNGLVGAAQDWMTPNVPNGGRSAMHAEMKGSSAYHNGRKVQIGLEHQVRSWASPTARIHKGGGNAVIRQDGKSRLDMLDWQAEAWSPSSPPDQTMPDGSTSSAPKRRLNPQFVDWLMGWCPGWTGSGPEETAWSAWLPRMRGELLKLVSPKPSNTLF